MNTVGRNFVKLLGTSPSPLGVGGRRPFTSPASTNQSKTAVNQDAYSDNKLSYVSKFHQRHSRF